MQKVKAFSDIDFIVLEKKKTEQKEVKCATEI